MTQLSSTSALLEPAPVVRATPPLLAYDREIEDPIGRREHAVRHALVEHPLLSLDAIAELAQELPPGAVERHHAAQPLLVPDGAPELRDSPADVVRTIETNGRWMVLWNIEQVPAYRRLLDSLLDPVVATLPPRERGMGRREAFLLVSAPEAITPVHFDPEHNFLLQIRGHKTIHVGRFLDRTAEVEELDRYHDGGHRNLTRMPPHSSTFVMDPGDGVYMYPWAPHWVQNGPRASVSLSITFRTGRSQRDERVHMLNARLRKRGLSPSPAGTSPARDEVKATLFELASWLRRRGRRERGARDLSS